MLQIWKEFCTGIEIHGNYNYRAEFVIFSQYAVLAGTDCEDDVSVLMTGCSVGVSTKSESEEDMIFLQWKRVFI